MMGKKKPIPLLLLLVIVAVIVVAIAILANSSVSTIGISGEFATIAPNTYKMVLGCPDIEIYTGKSGSNHPGKKCSDTTFLSSSGGKNVNGKNHASQMHCPAALNNLPKKNEVYCPAPCTLGISPPGATAPFCFDYNNKAITGCTVSAGYTCLLDEGTDKPEEAFGSVDFEQESFDGDVF